MDSEALNLEGLSLAHKGDYLGALLCFQKAIELNPNNAKAWYNCGTSLTSLGKFDNVTLGDIVSKTGKQESRKRVYEKGGIILNLAYRKFF